LIHILQNYDEPAGAEDSSSAGNLVQTDRRYGWPPQNDRGGVKRQTISGKEKDSSSAGNFVQTDRRYGWPPQNDSDGVKRQTISVKEIPHEKAKKPVQGKGISTLLENIAGFYQAWMRGYCRLCFQTKRKIL
jgi:hypothetical protein